MSNATRLRLPAIALMLVFSSGCSPMDDVLAAIFGRSMRDQPHIDPYEHTLAPPENSVPFAAGNLTSGPFEVNLGQPEVGSDVPDFTGVETMSFDPALDAIVNPVPADEASLARGEEMYLRACAVCHGPSGLGSDAYIIDKHPVLIGFQPAGPRVAQFSDGYLYAIVRTGRGLMPSYRHQVTHHDRWHIVNYLRTLQRAAGNTPIIDQAGGN